MIGQRFRVLLCVVFASISLANAAGSQTYLEYINNQFAWPVYGVSPPGATNRMFVVENYTGQITILNPSTHVKLEPAVLDIDDMPDPLAPEQGLLGMALDPTFATNGYFYVDHNGSNGDLVIERYQMIGNPMTSNVADINSRQLILTIPKPSGQHNGGWLGFSPKDGYLYVTVGDGGGAWDEGDGHTPGVGNAQDITDNLLGKILRLDVHGDDFPADPNRNYAIPPSNPFVGREGDDEIWAYGFRNPWRASFDSATGDLWIGDVGQSDREEIDFQPASSKGGENYGWRVREGSIAGAVGGGPSPPGAIEPIYDYPHDGPADYSGVAVVGGAVYHGPVAAFDGHYIFGDLLAHLWELDPDAIDPRASVTNIEDRLVPDNSVFSHSGGFAYDADGNMYALNLFVNGGIVFRIATHSKDIVWNGNSNGAGTAGDGASWSNANNWTRDGAVDTAFVAEDNVIFGPGSTHSTIDLEDNQTVSAVTFAAPYRLQNQTLTVLSGNITVQAGVTATIDSDLTAMDVNHSIRKLGDGTLLVNGHAGQTAVKAGTVGGVGTFDHLTVHDGGTVNPGPVTPGTPTGILTVSNSFTLQPGSRLAIEIGGTNNSDPVHPQFDKLSVGGVAQLGGTLAISLVDLGMGVFSPANGNSFDILSAGSGITGSFDLLDLPALTTGLVWKYGVNGNVFSLTVAPRFPGDYNGNDRVDAADYAVWRKSFGVTGDKLAADGSGPGGVPDGVVDNYDFDFWRAHYGMMANGQGNSAEVPEPTSAGLVMILGGAFLFRFSPRRGGLAASFLRRN